MLETALGVLNTVPRLIEGGATNAMQVAKGKKSFGQGLLDTAKELNPYSTTTGETPLAELGMEPGLARTALGFGLDIAAPVGPVGAAAGLGAKLLGKGVGKAAMKVAPEVSGKVVKGFNDAFVLYPGLDTFVGKSGLTAQDRLRLNESQIHAAHAAVKNELAKIFAGIQDADRAKIADYMNDPVTFALSDQTHLDAASKAKTLLDNQFAREIEKGVQHRWKLGDSGEVLLDDQLKPISNKIDNYYPWVMPARDGRNVLEVNALPTANRFNKARTLEDWAAAKDAGAEVDPIQAISKRINVGERAATNAGLFEDMAKEFGVELKKGARLPQGYRRLNPDRLQLVDLDKLDALQGVVLPNEIADALEKNHVIFKDPQGFGALLKNINQGFKTVVTSWNPAHHANNLHGNMALMAMGGMTPQGIARAYSPGELRNLTTLLGDPLKPTPQNVLDTLRNQKLVPNMTVGDALDAAKKYNLFGSSEASIDLERALGHDKGVIGRITDKARYNSSRYIEDPAKWALFKDQLLKGKSAEQAAIHVKNHLFDYAELTDTEKAIRDYGLMPFYTWMRKNLPLQAQKATEGSLGLESLNPMAKQTFRRLNLTYDLPNKLNPAQEGIQDPQWMREDGYVPNPLAPEGEDGSRQMVRLANPSLDLNKLSPNALASQLGPIPKTLIELATGRDLRTGKQVLGTPDGYVAANPLSAVLEQARMKGAPLGPLAAGAQSTIDGKVIQPEAIAFALNHIPQPWVPYLQRVAGDPGETIGTKMNTPIGKKVMSFVLQGLGLTMRDITPEQQLQIFQKLMDNLTDKPIKNEMIKATGAALRNQ
jgi:hypothetical protein